jgi:O-antigen biosynthesis protein
VICPECKESKKFRNTKGNIWRMACACGDFADFEPSVRASIIVPSKFPEIFADCRDTINKFAPKERKILVRDGNSIDAPDGWTTIQGPDGRFVYSRNVNLGIAASSGDVLLTNDDVRFTQPNTLEIMQNILHKHPEVGILSPLIRGDVGEYWQSHATNTLHYTQVRLCFVCVLIRREVIEKVGLLDERFTGYGYDDCDYSRRVVQAGWKLGVTARATVIHGHAEHRRSASFNRQEMGTINALDALAQKQYFEKWGDLSLECK